MLVVAVEWKLAKGAQVRNVHLERSVADGRAGSTVAQEDPRVRNPLARNAVALVGAPANSASLSLLKRQRGQVPCEHSFGDLRTLGRPASEHLGELCADGVAAVAQLRPGVVGRLVLGRVHNSQLQAKERSVIHLLARMSEADKRKRKKMDRLDTSRCLCARTAPTSLPCTLHVDTRQAYAT